MSSRDAARLCGLCAMKGGPPMMFNRQSFVRMLLVSFTLGIGSAACLAQQRITLKSANGTVLTASKWGIRTVKISAGNRELLEFGPSAVEFAVVLSGAAD